MTNQTPNMIVLHRWADREGKKLCAMSAISKKLGNFPLTDAPKGVDPGLATLVNLLNDRANDKARQLLISRLDHIPNTGRTDICSLIANVYFPQVIEDNGFEAEAKATANCKGRRAATKAYASLGERFLKSDGVGYLASGCITLAAALKTRDPIAQDILAVSAASRVVSFETGDSWFELLYILDYILGLEDSPYAGSIQSLQDYYTYFRDYETASEPSEAPELIIENKKPPLEKIYDFGIRVQWFPALVEKFPERLEEIAEQILDEVAALDSVTIYMHRFRFEDEEVLIVTSWDEDLDMLFADADLVAYMDPSGEVDLDGDGEAITLMIPVPASEAESVH